MKSARCPMARCCMTCEQTTSSKRSSVRPAEVRSARTNCQRRWPRPAATPRAAASRPASGSMTVIRSATSARTLSSRPRPAPTSAHVAARSPGRRRAACRIRLWSDSSQPPSAQIRRGVMSAPGITS
jgi:hypothetical protein